MENDSLYCCIVSSGTNTHPNGNPGEVAPVANVEGADEAEVSPEEGLQG